MNWFGIGAILSVTGAILYWRYLNRVSRNPRSHLIDDLTRVITNIPNKTVIYACNRYRRLLIQYEREIEDNISGVENLINSDHKESADQWKQGCADNFKTLLYLLKIYAQNLETTEEELLTVLNNQTYVALINASYDGLAEHISNELKTVTWKELVKGDIIATFALKFFLIENIALTNTEYRVEQLFAETKDALLSFEGDIEIDRLIKVLVTNLEELEGTEVSSDMLNNHFIFWKEKQNHHFAKLKIKSHKKAT